MKRGSFDQPAPVDTEAQRKPPLEAGGATIGKKVSRDVPQDPDALERARQENQDTGIADADLGLFGVADGMGGSEGGAVASRLTIKALETVVRQKRTEKGGQPFTKAEREAVLREAVDVAQDQVTEVGNKHSALEDMGTTVSAFLIDRTAEGKREASFAHVGDSRVYRFDAKKGQLDVVSKDDSLPQVLVDAGLISEEAAILLDQSQEKGGNVLRALKSMRRTEDLEVLGGFDGLTSKAKALALANPTDTNRSALLLARQMNARQEEAQRLGKPSMTVPEMLFAMRNLINKAVRVGVKEEAQIDTFEVEDGDIVFAASDGLGDVLTIEDMEVMIKRGLKEGKSWGEIAQELAATAKADKSDREKKGGDDITIEGAMVHPEEKKQGFKFDAPGREAFSPDRIAGWQQARKEYQSVLDSVAAVRAGQEKLRQQLELLGENFDNPDFSQLALLEADRTPHKKEYLERAYVRPGGYSLRNLEAAMRAAKVWASQVMASSDGKLRSYDDVLLKFAGNAKRKRESYDQHGVELVEYERIAAEREPAAVQADIMLLRAKAENLELAEEGDQITLSIGQGAPDVRLRVKKMKDGLLLEPDDAEDLGFRMRLRQEDFQNSRYADALRQEYRNEADRREKALIASQSERAQKSAR